MLWAQSGTPPGPLTISGPFSPPLFGALWLQHPHQPCLLLDALPSLLCSCSVRLCRAPRTWGFAPTPPLALSSFSQAGQLRCCPKSKASHIGDFTFSSGHFKINSSNRILSPLINLEVINEMSKILLYVY